MTSLSRESDEPGDETVRIEIMLHGEKHHHYVKTRLFMDSLQVNRRGEQVSWYMDVVRLGMKRAQAVKVLQHTLHMMDDADKWAIVEPIVRELQENGHRFRDMD